MNIDLDVATKLTAPRIASGGGTRPRMQREVAEIGRLAISAALGTASPSTVTDRCRCSVYGAPQSSSESATLLVSDGARPVRAAASRTSAQIDVAREQHRREPAAVARARVAGAAPAEVDGVEALLVGLESAAEELDEDLGENLVKNLEESGELEQSLADELEEQFDGVEDSSGEELVRIMDNACEIAWINEDGDEEEEPARRGGGGWSWGSGWTSRSTRRRSTRRRRVRRRRRRRRRFSRRSARSGPSPRRRNPRRRRRRRKKRKKREGRLFLKRNATTRSVGNENRLWFPTRTDWSWTGITPWLSPDKPPISGTECVSAAS